MVTLRFAITSSSRFSIPSVARGTFSITAPQTFSHEQLPIAVKAIRAIMLCNVARILFRIVWIVKFDIVQLNINTSVLYVYLMGVTLMSLGVHYGLNLL
jgi:hypothetical protein